MISLKELAETFEQLDGYYVDKNYQVVASESIAEGPALKDDEIFDIICRHYPMAGKLGVDDLVIPSSKALLEYLASASDSWGCPGHDLKENLLVSNFLCNWQAVTDRVKTDAIRVGRITEAVLAFRKEWAL